MQRDARAYLWDARQAAEAIMRFIGGKEQQDFEQDLLLRSGVERQFEIVGEALNQLSRTAPEVARRIPDLVQVVAFRNILVHGYAAIDNERVWRITQESLPDLLATLEQLLLEAPPPTGL